MTYRVFYDQMLVLHTAAAHREDASRIEYFLTEREALKRARQLLDAGDHDGVAVCDGSGDVIAGVRLQLKLGFRAE
jgi:hypothetical protein